MRVRNENNGENNGTLIQAGAIGSLSTGSDDAQHTGSGTTYRDTAVQTGEGSIQINGDHHGGINL
ncbi:hypothetical protein ADK70_17345 [Streptomyces rimosus subsp. pseudoverticillatus]|uniref:hypothetical protein n=1 Tax=Streptomyces rimosus TaxID=1927 RepID=UPI0006B282DF|nr:hypothetical protein [Streptomyces rimosus]KOT90899.1 hypothetical protein ADK70_17345 [Streptomyces rimosus subsp. pseudoverticillatus]